MDQRVNKMLAIEILAAAMLLLMLIVPIVLIVILCVYEYKRARKVGPITQEPVVPQWTRSQNIRKESRANVTVYRRPFDRQFFEYRGRRFELPRYAFWTIKKIIRERTGMLIPTDCCIVQVALNGFTCGQRCTDFEGPGTFKYRMYGPQRIQMVTSTENNVEKIAGFCMFLETPYDGEYFINKDIINRCFQQPSIQIPAFGDIELNDFVVV